MDEYTFHITKTRPWKVKTTPIKKTNKQKKPSIFRQKGNLIIAFRAMQKQQ